MTGPNQSGRPSPDERQVPWYTQPALWEKLRPEARAMRKAPTTAEELLWALLRGSQTGLRFRRQHAIGRFIVDFYCPKTRLVIEVDGPIHERSQEQDAQRDAELRELGFHVLRLTNEQVLGNPASALNLIRQALNRNT